MEYCVKEKRVAKGQPELWKKKAGAISDSCLIDSVLIAVVYLFYWKEILFGVALTGPCQQRQGSRGIIFTYLSAVLQNPQSEAIYTVPSGTP